jgi:hypothetical protein
MVDFCGTHNFGVKKSGNISLAGLSIAEGIITHSVETRTNTR